MTLETWDYVAPELSKNHRVLRYDLRGYGLSQAIKGPIKIDDQVSDLVELLKSLKINGKVHLVGGAIGGAVALKFAADHPELVENVISISPAAYLQGRATQTAAPPPAGAAPAGPPADIGEAAYPSALRKIDPARYARFKAIEGSSASASGGGQSTMAAVYAVKFAEVLPTIKVPAVIVATSLWIRTPADFKELADAIPNSQFEVLETGHFAPLASPDMVIALIKRYVKQR
jgi:3-oxoadipate enol-lactonase